MVMAVMLFAALVAIYAFWIRSILRSRPALRELYRREESFFAALREKLKGIKQKLSTAAVVSASAAVSGYDFFAPIVGGVDVSGLTSHVPSWAWPLILILVAALFQFLRNLADTRNAEQDALRASPGRRR